MRILALILILSACAPLCWQPLRGQPPSVRKEASSKKKNVSASSPSKATADQRGTKNSPLVVDTEGHQETPAEAKEKAREKEIKNKIDSRSLLSAEITAGATVVLMFVGAGGVVLALRTLRAIENQATLMRTPFYQWVELHDWKADWIPRTEPIKKLRITVNLVNPTQFPLKIASGQITFGDPLVTTMTHLVGEDSFLPPKSPHVIDVTVDLADNEAAQFADGTFDLMVRGTFSHIGPLGDGILTHQPFLGVLACGKWGSKFHPDVHMNPKIWESKPQKAN
jgi:hypothetical protein